MATIWTKEEVIQAASEEFEGIVNHPLITKAKAIDLADWGYDYPLMRTIKKDQARKAVYFMFAHFILLALEEES